MTGMGQGRRYASRPVLVALFTLGYFAACQYSFLLQVHKGSVEVLWPASGLAAAAVVGLPRDRRWVVGALVLANTAMNLLHGKTVLLSAGLGVANAAEALAFAALFTWLAAGRTGLPRWGSLVAACLGAATVGAVLGSGTVTVGLGADPLTAFRTWLVADGVGMLLVAPIFLTLSRPVPRVTSLRWGAEVLAAVGLLAAATVVAFGSAEPRPTAYLTLPPMLWCALRLGSRATASLGALMAGAAALLTVHGRGVLGELPTAEGVTILQVFLVVATLATVSLAVSVDESRRTTADLAEREALFRHNFDDALLGMLLLELVPGTEDWPIIQANASARRMLQLPADQCDLAGATWRRLVAGDDRQVALDVMARFASGELSSWQGELEHEVAGQQHWLGVSMAALRSPLADGSAQLTLQLVDVTARKVAEMRLTEMAMHDSLTGLPNRLLLTDRLEQALAASKRTGLHVAVMFLDLDDFKNINDADGHQTGDEVLKIVAGRLQEVVRPGDTISRWGGDEFVLLCPNLGAAEDASRVAERVLSALGRPIEIGDHRYSVNASMGIALAAAGDQPGTLLSHADAAMYAAKRRGKGRCEVFALEMHTSAARNADLGPRLQLALQDDEFRLHFQPVVDLATSRVLAVEALIRWAHPERGLLPPAEWLDVVERSDLVVGMGRWVLQEACRWGAMWRETLGELAPIVHVNISARHLNHPSFLGDVRQALHDSGCSPLWLVIEVTETHLLTVSPGLRRDLERLRTLGVRLAADDYGTGYSALSQVVELDVDQLKIDRSFVAAMDTSRRAHAVVHAIIGLGNALGLEVVAEGVERPDQAAELLRLGCLSAQGYLWSAARPPEEVPALVHAAAGAAEIAGAVSRPLTPAQASGPTTS
jgi:diguanylate cyclase (GGDEF)-like protein